MTKGRNYRGAKTATVITVFEGDGTKDSPYEEVQYVIGSDEFGAKTMGRIVWIDMKK